MLVQISKIKINSGRREARAENVREIADSIHDLLQQMKGSMKK